ncbi:hypothetical protein THAOC_02138 [Thalassiosira oceanica]|uniref:Uncharacterized protein n=1 Tax=Thalassiosira oceanica TaxID=159749 RepID=K0TQI7_THAOC|nr:hypothetical protein THAOC_02138 [Thalassiosira oceanica]|eukprot:EJK76117.1 hypothetical protein THAOC_02138 [Thalassiosira oceanica]
MNWAQYVYELKRVAGPPSGLLPEMVNPKPAQGPREAVLVKVGPGGKFPGFTSVHLPKVAPAQMDGQGSRGEQLGKLRAEREAKAIMPGKLRAEREAKAIMKLAGRDKSQWCNLHVIG